MAGNNKRSEFLTCSRVLNLMVILGFMFNYMLRVNLTIAIVEMVVPVSKNVTQLTGTTSNVTSKIFSANEIDTFDKPSLSMNETIATSTVLPSVLLDDGERYEWDARVQNWILGCFFWGYVLTELPGGRLAEVIGARRVFGYAMLFGSLLTLLTPIAARLGYVAIIILRTLLGFMMGATWPSIQPLASKWIPPNERSKFVANMMASSLGAAITMPVCGFLIASFGWPSVFYLTGAIGLIWSIAWFFVVFETPADHPRMSIEERTAIEEAIKRDGKQGNKPKNVPWKAILLSGPVWAIVITHGCSVFGYFTIVNQLPTYMKYILHFDIKANGLLSSLPYLGKYIFAVVTSTLADHLRKTARLTTTQTRKMFTTLAVLVPGLLMVLQVYMGINATWAIAIFTAALTVNGAVTAGYLGNGLDIAPNFSGTIFGMANTLSSFGGYLSTHMVGILTYNNQTYEQWTKVFWILFGTYSLGALSFLILGSGELQPWNNDPISYTSNGKTADDEKSSEETPLKEIS